MAAAPWAQASAAAQGGPLQDAAARIAWAAARQASTAQPTPAAEGASRAEKIAWAYLLIGGTVFIVTSPGEKGEGGKWSNDGKWEMAGGIGAVAISFALLHDILARRRRP
jgi:hypothetical protein